MLPATAPVLSPISFTFAAQLDITEVCGVKTGYIMEVTVRLLKNEDYAGLRAAMIEAYNGIGGVWREANIGRLLGIFPAGQFCVEVDGKVAACALSIIVQYELFGDEHTYEEITGNYTFDTHFDDGDVLYGI